MRTTFDIDVAVLERAKRHAAREKKTLGAVVTDALVAYLRMRKPASKEPPFELIVRGTVHGRFPTAAELSAVDDQDDR